MFGDLAVADAIELNPIELHGAAGGRDALELAAMRAGDAPAGDHRIVFRDAIFDVNYRVWKRGDKGIQEGGPRGAVQRLGRTGEGGVEVVASKRALGGPVALVEGCDPAMIEGLGVGGRRRAVAMVSGSSGSGPRMSMP